MFSTLYVVPGEMNLATQPSPRANPADKAPDVSISPPFRYAASPALLHFSSTFQTNATPNVTLLGIPLQTHNGISRL